MRVKKAIKAVAFCIVLALFLNHIYEIFAWKDTAGNYDSSLASFYELEEDVVDVLFLGSSRCYCTINNSILWEEQGIGSFSLSISGQDIVSSYHCIVEALKTQTPEVICLELYGATFHGYGVESNMYRNTLPYKYSLNAFSVVNNIAEDRTAELLLRWPIVHTRYKELQKEDFADDRPAYIGHRVNFTTNPVGELCTYQGTEQLPIAEEEEKWLRKIIALAEENDIELCFFVAPAVLSEKEQKNYNYVETIASEHNIPMLNMPMMQEDLQLDINTDFIDWAHVNYYGSQKVSSFMGNFLMQNFDLADRRGQEGYELWDEDALIRKHEYYEQMLKQTTTMQHYMDFLVGATDYTVIIASSGLYDTEEVSFEEYEMAFGLEGFYDAAGIWVIDNGQIVLQSVGENTTKYMELPQGDLAVANNDGITNIVIDRQSYVKVSNGINVVVYDNVLEKVVDAVGFEINAQYGMRR